MQLCDSYLILPACICRRYERAGKTLDGYQSDIAQYKVTIEEILLENTKETVRFLIIDCGPLKQVLGLSTYKYWYGFKCTPRTL